MEEVANPLPPPPQFNLTKAPKFLKKAESNPIMATGNITHHTP